MLEVKIFIFLAFLLMLFEPSELVNTECTYGVNNWLEIGSAYQCTVKNNLNIKSRESAVFEHAKGTHISGRIDNNVTTFYAYNKTVQHFPRGLQKIFVNLKGIEIDYGRIKELHQDDLKEYVKLENLWLYNNDIQILVDGLFSHNLQLKLVNFRNNKIFHIDEHVFDQLHNLNQLLLEGNKCIDQDVGTNAKIKELIKELKDKCYSQDFVTIDKDLKQLEDAVTDENNKNCENLAIEFQELKNRFQKSSISSDIVIKERVQKLWDESVHGQICAVNKKLSDMKISFSDFKDKTQKLMDQTVTGINEQLSTKQEQLSKKQKADDEKFEKIEKSIANLKDELMEMIASMVSIHSTQELSTELPMDRQNKIEEADAAPVLENWKLLIQCITVFTQIIFLIVIYRKLFVDSASA